MPKVKKNVKVTYVELANQVYSLLPKEAAEIRLKHLRTLSEVVIRDVHHHKNLLSARFCTHTHRQLLSYFTVEQSK